MANIGDLFFLFRGDDSQLQVDAAKSGDTAGSAAGKRFSVSMGTALKAGIGGAIGGALSAGLSIATKGGAELNAAVTAFAADTGATTEEAAAAQSTIGELFRTNLQSFGEIGGTLAVLRTDLGLTRCRGQGGPELPHFAQSRAAPSRGAGRFDDLLGALNLDARRRPGSGHCRAHQRYRQSINANIDALTAMAPRSTRPTSRARWGRSPQHFAWRVDAAAATAAPRSIEDGQESRRAPDAHRPDQRDRGSFQTRPARVGPVRRKAGADAAQAAGQVATPGE